MEYKMVLKKGKDYGPSLVLKKHKKIKKDMLFKKGRHYCTPFPWPNFYKINNKNRLFGTTTVIFTDSCRYLIGKDQSDVNKLFGFSYGFHHNNSDRIGWRYLPKEDKIEIVLYSYVDKKRIKTQSIEKIDLNTRYDISLDVYMCNNGRQRQIIVEIFPQITRQFIQKNFTYQMKHKHCLGYTLGGYFGGNIRAPHDILIQEMYVHIHIMDCITPNNKNIIYEIN